MRHLLPLIFKVAKPSTNSMDWMYGHRIDWNTRVSAGR